MSYSYTITIGVTTFTPSDMEKIIDSSTLKIVKPFCSTKKTSGTGTMSVVAKGAADPVFYQTFMTALLGAQQAQEVNDCQIVVNENSKAVFRGYLDLSTIQINSAKLPQNLTLSAKDKSILLDKKIRMNKAWENQKRSTIISELLAYLDDDYGTPVALLSDALPATKKIKRFAVTEAKEQTYRDVIDKVLLESAGYVLWYDPEYDGFRVMAIQTDLTGLTPRVIEYLVKNQLQTKSAIYEKDGVLLSFPNVVERPNTNIYTENISVSIDDNNYVTGQDVPSGHYFPSDGDIKEIYQQYRVPDRPYISHESRLQNNDLKLIYCKDVEYSLQSNPKLSIAPALPNVKWTEPEYYPDRARLLFINNNPNNYFPSEDTSALDAKDYYKIEGGQYVLIAHHTPAENPKALGWYEAQGANVSAFSITGTAVYESYLNKVTVGRLDPDPITGYGSPCTNPEEYKADTIQYMNGESDFSEAIAFAKWYYKSLNYGQTTSQWTECPGVSNLGEVVYVAHKMTGIMMPHIVVQITDESVDGSRVRCNRVVAISIYGWEEYVYDNGIVADGNNGTQTERANRILTGDILVGTATCRGVAGIVGDIYINDDETSESFGNMYKCIVAGTAFTAIWEYQANIKGKDASVIGLTYEIEYGLSTSPEECVFPEATYGYDSDHAYGYDENNEYGFNNVGGWSSTYDGWYKGLYVWQRIKITDAEGNITYEEPTYAEATTISLINGCIFNVLLIDSDGDGNTHTWEKNLASANGTIDVQFNLSARSYGSIASFESALQSVVITPYKGQTALTPITVSAPSIKIIDDNTKTVKFLYEFSFAKKADYDSLVINALITDTYLNADGSTLSVDTLASETMNAVDVTVLDAFGGIFESDSDAEDYFEQQYEGIMEGYTYSCSHEGYEDHLALKTYFNGAWIYMSNLPSSFSLARVSAICAKAQKAVLSQIPEGTVTMSDFGYFNIVIANVVTSRFIGSKQIQLQVDDEGNPGYIYGGDVDPTQNFKNRVGTMGFIIDTLGQMEASEAYFKNCEIDGASIISSLLFSNGAEINHPYFKTISTAGTDMTVENLPAKTHWYTGDINWNTVFPTANSFTSFSDSYINNSTTISSGIRVTNPNYALIASGTTVGSHSFGPGSWGGTATLISSVQYKGTYTLSFNAPDATYSLIYVNGNQVLSGAFASKSTTITLNKGDRVTCECGNSIYMAESTYTVKANSVTLSGNGYPNVGIYLIGGSTYFYNSFNEYKPSSTRWYFKNGYGTVLFDSNLNIRYAHLESIVTGYMSSLASGKTYTATGIVTYNGISCTVANISKDSASTGRLTIFDSVPNFYVINMAANEYSNISGDVQILGSQAGILTHAIYPEDTETYDIGEGGKQYRRIYCVNVVESSRRDLKTNIEPFTDNAIDLLKTVEVSKYNLKCDMELPDDEIVDYIGFIADDTDARLSGKKHDKFNHINCIGVLIKAVQELSAEINKLKGGN